MTGFSAAPRIARRAYIDMTRFVATRIALYIFIVVLFGGIAFVGQPFYVQVAIGVAISAILALSWDILSRTGQVSLGQAAFFGIGAYGAAILSPYLGTTLSWIAALLLCAVTAILLGLITLRLRKLYFTIATLAFTLSIQVLVLVFPAWTGGSTGILPPLLAGGSPPQQLLIITTFLVGAAVISDILLGWRFRPACFMIRSNPDLAAASGVPVVAIKIFAFAISGMVAGVAGICYAGLYGFIIPTDVFTLHWSVLPLAIGILGGMDTTLGAIVGAIALRLLEGVGRYFFGGAGYQVVYGAVIIVFITVMPYGLVGAFRRLALAVSRKWRRS